MPSFFDSLRHNVDDNEVIKFYGNHRAIVVDNKDPEVKGRCRLFVPGVYPDDFATSPSSLPWAEPAMDLFGGNWTSPGETDLNAETGTTSIPIAGKGPTEGAQVWCFFEAGDANFPVFFAACQAGAGWLSEHSKQHVIKTSNVRMRIDENPTLPEKAKGKSTWKLTYTIYSPNSEQSMSGDATAVAQVFKELDQRGEYVSEMTAGGMTYVHGVDEPTLEKAVMAGGQVSMTYYKFEESDKNEQEFNSKEELESFLSDLLSEKADNEIYETSIEETPCQEDREKSTCKFTSYNESCVVQSKRFQKKNRPTRIDIEIKAPDLNADVPQLSGTSTQTATTSGNTPKKKPDYGIALNVQITGDVNLKVKGDVYEHIEGNKHQTLSGDLYYRQVGDVYHRVEGNYYFTVDTREDSNYGGNYKIISKNYCNVTHNRRLDIIGMMQNGINLGEHKYMLLGDEKKTVYGPASNIYYDTCRLSYDGGLVERINLSHLSTVGVDYSQIVFGNKYTSTAKLNMDSSELLKFNFVKVAELGLNMGVYSDITVIGGLKVNGYFGVEVFGLVEIEICGLVKGCVAGTVNAEVAPIITHN